MDDPIRILVAGPRSVVRRGVRALLRGEPDLRVVGEAAYGRSAIAKARRLRPRVILIDLGLPDLDAAAAVRAIHAEQPETAVLLLAEHEDDPRVLTALRAGALGCLAMTAGEEDFRTAIRRVARGELCLPAHLSRTLLTRLGRRQRLPDSLTARETEVLRLLAEGKSNQEIAGALEIAEVTVRTHVGHILDKLGASNRVEAALHALRSGLAVLKR